MQVIPTVEIEPDLSNIGMPVRRAKTWHLAFSQDCNLRCSYCVTGYGTLGSSARVMTEATQLKVLQHIFLDRQQGEEIALDFGIGETLYYFDSFMGFISRAKAMSKDYGTKLWIHVSTNGVDLDDEKIALLAAHQIALTFSIDGPAHIHDRIRKDQQGLPTQAKALENWRKYREISLSSDKEIGCDVQSVVSDYSSLKEVHEFWLEQGLNIYHAIIEEPSEFVGEKDTESWRERRKRYLDDMESIALEQAEKLTVPLFLSEFKGPYALIKAWTDIFLERDAGACSVGEGIMAIDVDGYLYPCDGFIGQRAWSVGQVNTGYQTNKLARFNSDVKNLRHACNSCEAQMVCDGGCVATKLDTNLKLNKSRACSFTRELTDIAQDSYGLMLNHI